MRNLLASLPFVLLGAGLASAGEIFVDPDPDPSDGFALESAVSQANAQSGADG